MRLFANPNSKLFRQDYLRKTKGYFDRYGGRTIMARFMPIVRTFAPFVAGMGKMPLRDLFVLACWADFCGFRLFMPVFYFGGIPAVRKTSPLLILGIILCRFTCFY